ncbi:glycosyltransferase family 2 protein [Mesorhizobium sp.]|jgi:glycosyltransferase involved in cell wall biosynthesis|uniref:glycosyltransferase family 2 protein n=1 Tax=Mesorhizobium sp. TaxID=1871066 RepID=UPI000FE50045|nr:MAG: glycosyltransferase family 2 protein [Mesorhizobium sp.]TIN28417.1 MAG: glycosyltransferase family 2 protein [Mesorhizobium sp.]TIN36028.1 MAG: glycosyltransferase family 2 protein [Mesorhizobium sp.]TJU84842.1 MAG: glycosyltransferase family 2 protein [Mesorhizobium sp.]TJU85474.1 MAG: glycosyltransferase family 2 protein [Mesorhizobium sp.]
MANLSDESAALVSVVIPVHNGCGFVENAVRCAAEQTWPSIEIIVVDDGSTDATASVVRECAARDKRVRLIHQANGGVAVARNAGIASAQGDYVAFLDADDLWHREKISKQMEVMQRGGADIGIVYCRYREVDSDGAIINSPHFPPYEGYVYPLLVLFNFMGGGSAVLVRRKCLLEIGGFDPSLRARGAQGAEDTRAFLAISERYTVRIVDSYLMGYRLSDGSMSSNIFKMFKSRQIVLREVRNRHPELPAFLFRWAVGENASWLAEGSLREGKFRQGLALLARTILIDPQSALNLRIARSLTRGISRRLKDWFGWTSSDHSVKSKRQHIRHFHEISPEEGLQTEPRIPDRHDRRRAVAARLAVAGVVPTS